jgi:Putative transposase
VTFIQRADSALRLNPHAHTLALDGVYVRDAARVLVFHALPAPSAEDVQDVAERTYALLQKVLARHGRSLDGEPDDAFASEQAVLASCYGASASDLQLLGANAGQRTTKLVRALCEVPHVKSERAHAEVGGVNIHADVAFDGRDRKRLERLVRYVTRPPMATERLEEHTGGRLRYGFKKPWRDGTPSSSSRWI